MQHHNIPPMPSLTDQINLLRTTGEQFTDAEKEASRLELPGVFMAQGDGSEKALYDSRVIPNIPRMIVPSSHVYPAVASVRTRQLTLNHGGSAVAEWLSGEGLTIGFSGYGTAGDFGYETEYQGIKSIFEHAQAAGIAIDGVVDGGTGYGVPGLSGTMAQQYGLATIGFAPLRSLRGAAPRDTFAVIGEEFGDEAVALGSTPDLLVAIGGGPNAEKEVEAAMAVGNQVILAALKQYPESSVAYLAARNERAKAARETGKLVLCNTIEEVTAVLDDLSLADLHANRAARAAVLKPELAPDE